MNQNPRGLASSRARQAWLRACRDAGQPEVKFYEGTKHTFASAALDRTESATPSARSKNTASEDAL